MTGMSVKVEGADRLARTAARAASKMADLTAAHRRIAEGIRGAANPPRRSGALAASLTTSATPAEATVSSGLIYAPVIENGWPGHGIEPTHFLSDAHRSQHAEALAAYTHHIRDAIGGVRGV